MRTLVPGIYENSQKICDITTDPANTQFVDTTDTSILTSKYWPVPVLIPITTDVATKALNWQQKS